MIGILKVPSHMKDALSVFSLGVCACLQIAVCCLLAAIVIYSVRPRVLPYTCVQKAARRTCLLLPSHRLARCPCRPL